MAKRKKLTPDERTRVVALLDDARKDVRHLIELLQTKLAEKRST